MITIAIVIENNVFQIMMKYRYFQTKYSSSLKRL